MFSDLASAVTVAAIPLLHHGPGLGCGGLVALVTLLGTLRGFGDSAKRVLLPRTIATAGIHVTRATGLHDGMYRLSTLLGPPVAGLLITAFDATAVLLLDAASFAIAALLIALLVPGGAAEQRREPYLRALRAGWRFIGRDRLLLSVALMIFVTNLLDQAYAAVLAPVWASDVIGSATALGLLFGLFGAGAVAGSAVFAVLAVYLAATLAPIFSPVWRELDRSAGQRHEDQEQHERDPGDGEEDEQVAPAGVRSGGRGGDGLGG